MGECEHDAFFFPSGYAVGVVVGITVLNKYAVVFWLSGMIVGVLLTPLRQSLRNGWFWLGCVLAVAIAGGGCA